MKKLFSITLNFMMLVVYLILLSIFMFSFVFIGEDVELNSSKTYISFTIYSLVFFSFAHISTTRTKSVIYKVVILASSALICPLLISGFIGAVDLSSPVSGLSLARITAVILDIFLVISSIKGIKLWS